MEQRPVSVGRHVVDILISKPIRHSGRVPIGIGWVWSDRVGLIPDGVRRRDVKRIFNRRVILGTIVGYFSIVSEWITNQAEIITRISTQSAVFFFCIPSTRFDSRDRTFQSFDFDSFDLGFFFMSLRFHSVS